VNWYEWFDETLSVFLQLFVVEFGVWVKIPKFCYGTRRPHRVLCGVLSFSLLDFVEFISHFVGVMGGKFNLSLFLLQLFVFL
jgi:hypothetical protein